MNNSCSKQCVYVKLIILNLSNSAHICATSGEKLLSNQQSHTGQAAIENALNNRQTRIKLLKTVFSIAICCH